MLNTHKLASIAVASNVPGYETPISNLEGSKSTPVANNVSHASGETKPAFLNIGGFVPKLKIPEFHIFIKQYDIIGLVETKLNKHSTKVMTNHSS